MRAVVLKEVSETGLGFQIWLPGDSEAVKLCVMVYNSGLELGLRFQNNGWGFKPGFGFPKKSQIRASSLGQDFTSWFQNKGWCYKLGFELQAGVFWQGCPSHGLGFQKKGFGFQMRVSGLGAVSNDGFQKNVWVSGLVQDLDFKTNVRGSDEDSLIGYVFK